MKKRYELSFCSLGKRHEFTYSNKIKFIKAVLYFTRLSELNWDVTNVKWKDLESPTFVFIDVPLNITSTKEWKKTVF